MYENYGVPDYKPPRKKRPPPSGDKKRFIPKSQPGKKWGADKIPVLNAGNHPGFKPSHYQDAIRQLLNDLYKENPTASYSISELKWRIAYIFRHNQIKLNVNRKSIESALAVMFSKHEITVPTKTAKYRKWSRTVLSYRLANFYDTLEKAVKVVNLSVPESNKLFSQIAALKAGPGR